MAPYGALALMAFLAYGAILWNGAGLSGMDDTAAAEMGCCELRPILAMTYRVNQVIGGWMLLNFGLHVLCSVLVYRVSMSFWAAGLFAVHPMAADSVASIAGRSALLAGCAVMAGVLLTRTYGKRFAVYAGIIAALILGMTPTMLWNAMNGTGFVGHVSAFLSAVAVYVLPNMIVPVSLSADPDIPSGFALAGAAMVAIAAVLAYRRPEYRLGIGLLALPLVPYALFPLPDVWLDHRGYIAIAGASILVVRLAPRGTVPAFVALMAVLAMGRVDVYSTPMNLWADTALKSPNKPRVHQNYGTALGMAGDYVGAEREFGRAIELDPRLGVAYSSKASVYLFATDRRIPVLEAGNALPGNFAEASRLLDEYSLQTKGR